METYYISDNFDSTDVTGGKVDAGSTTYRIYVDLKPGSVLTKIYGDANHRAKIASTTPFYNHSTEGQTFAKDFIKARYEESTVALDTWLTLGQTTKKQGAITNFGILKAQDTNGSFIGGTNNDGGSAVITGGLLVNNVPAMHIPLTTADGMDTMVNVPTTWIDNGIRDFVSGNDSTIFGSLVTGTEFISNNFSLQNTGVTGVVPDSNQILIAQLTTKGQLSFELNLEVQVMVDSVPTIIKYVANDSILLAGEEMNAFLTYPFICGCTDPNYMEFSPAFACYAPGTCITPIVYGCMDTMACNYDPTVNFSIPGLCCYPGFCADRDITVVCPSINGSQFEFEIYPNPTNDDLYLNVKAGDNQEMKYTVYNSFGVVVFEKDLGSINLIENEKIDLSNCDSGLYHIKVTVGDKFDSKLFMKN